MDDRKKVVLLAHEREQIVNAAIDAAQAVATRYGGDPECVCSNARQAALGVVAACLAVVVELNDRSTRP